MACWCKLRVGQLILFNSTCTGVHAGERNAPPRFGYWSKTVTISLCLSPTLSFLLFVLFYLNLFSYIPLTLHLLSVLLSLGENVVRRMCLVVSVIVSPFLFCLFLLNTHTYTFVHSRCWRSAHPKQFTNTGAQTTCLTRDLFPADLMSRVSKTCLYFFTGSIHLISIKWLNCRKYRL